MNTKYISTLLTATMLVACFIAGVAHQSHAQSTTTSGTAHATIIYPGFNDDGIKVDGYSKVDLGNMINLEARTTIMVTQKPVDAALKNQWKQRGIRVIDTSTLAKQGGWNAYLTGLKRDGIQDVVVNIDMQVGPRNFLVKGSKEQNWAGATGAAFESAYRNVFEQSKVGAISHSFGNGATTQSIMKYGTDLDYAVMLSPSAKRTKLNALADRIRNNKLVSATAVGDFHGMITYDGETRFAYLKYSRQKNPHSYMAKAETWRHDTNFITNLSKTQTTTGLEMIRQFIQVDVPRHHPSPAIPRIPSYFTSEGPGIPRGKTRTEARVITGFANDARKAVVFGQSSAADLTYRDMTQKLGRNNVLRDRSMPSPSERQRIARNFGGDVILGVRDARSDRSRLPDFNIGGVMLGGTATVHGDGAALTVGDFSLVFEHAEGGIEIGELRKFVTAAWATYFTKDGQGPGISIDPIAPGIDKHLVRYIGEHVINSDIGRVMRKTDYRMKKWAVGSARPNISGFENPDDISARIGRVAIGSPCRFWFLPRDMEFKLSKDGGASMLLFDHGNMTLQTECESGSGAFVGPAEKGFAEWVTAHYPEIAAQHHEFAELFDYAKLVSLNRYLKHRKIPMLWYLLANMDLVLTEDSPGTVKALAEKSQHFKNLMIEGGVDLAMPPSSMNYVIDEEAAIALQKARQLYGTGSRHTARRIAPTTITVATTDAEYTLTPSQQLSLSGSTVGGEQYQTDLALWKDTEPSLELARYYDPNYTGLSTFGPGWHLMIPYRVSAHGPKKIEYLNAMIPESMVVQNLLTGRKEVLSFDDTRYRVAGYVPKDPETTTVIGLFLLTNGSFRLADKLGNEFQFNSAGWMTEMILSQDYHVKYAYGREEVTGREFTTSPYRLVPVGNQWETVLNVTLPRRMKLVDARQGTEEVFVFDRAHPYNLVGYIPVHGMRSQYAALAVMSDGSFLLEDRNGKQVAFDGGGHFEHMTVPVVTGFSQGDHNVKFTYEFGNDMFRIREAKVSNKNMPTVHHVVQYEYDRRGRLLRVKPPAGQDKNLRYDNNVVLVASR